MTVAHVCCSIPSAFLELMKVELHAVFSSFSGQGVCLLLQECDSTEFLLKPLDC